MKVTKSIQAKNGMWVHMCPLCGNILASASEEEYMPAYSICDCDRNGNKKEVYELYEEDGVKMIRRNKPPRFIGKVVFRQETDIEVTEVLDYTSAEELAKAMRKAGEFLLKKSKNARETDI